MNNERIWWIDLYKGLAIICVITVHFSQVFGNFSPFINILSIAGSVAPQLFFIFSSFLLFKKNDFSNNKRDTLHFYLKSFIRIIPTFYFCLVIAIIYWAIADASILSPLNITSHFLFFNGFYPYWINSLLKVEWYVANLAIFYFAFPLVKKIVCNKKRAILFAVISIFLSILQSTLYLNFVAKINGDDVVKCFFQNWSFIQQLPSISLGILAFYLLNCKKNILLFSLSCCFLSIGIWAFDKFILHYFVSPNIIYSLMFFSIFLFSHLLLSKHKIKEFFFSFLGKHSLGIYLTHYILFLLISRTIEKFSLTINYWLLFFACLLISLSLGSLIDLSLGKASNFFSKKIIKAS